MNLLLTFQDDNDFKLFCKHLFGRDVPQWTRTVDSVDNRRGPHQEHKTVRILPTSLRFQVEWVLAQRNRFTLLRQPSNQHHSTEQYIID